MMNESSVYFFSGGGHNHDGDNSSLINTSAYSIFDFDFGNIGGPNRVYRQELNQNGFKQFIIATINSSILEPSGLVLQPGVVNGNAHIIAGSVTGNEISANTITANNIVAGTITADLLSANIVLVDNVIRSNNFDGTIAANGIITFTGNTGWAITWAGDAVFDSSVIRGSIQADSIYINNLNYWTSNGIFSVGAEDNILFYNGNSLSLTGTVFATSGQIAGWEINGDNLRTGGSFAGAMELGEFNTPLYNSAGMAGVLIEGPYDANAQYAYDSYMVNSELGIILKDGLANNAVVRSTIINSYGIQYSYGSEHFEFYWDQANTQLYAVIDGDYYCISNCADTPPAPEPEPPAVVVGVVVVVDPVVVGAEPPPPGPVCDPVCPPGFTCIADNICIG
jgi:hypothetical protein